MDALFKRVLNEKNGDKILKLLELFQRVIIVSLETVKFGENLPKMTLA